MAGSHSRRKGSSRERELAAAIPAELDIRLQRRVERYQASQKGANDGG